MTLTVLDTVGISAPVAVDGRGEVAVLNNTTDPSFVGFLRKATGFGGAAVRQSKDPVVEGGGTIVGSSYDDERSFTLEVQMARAVGGFNASDDRYRKLCRAWYAMRADGQVFWIDRSGDVKTLFFRRDQPPSDPDETGTVLLAGVAPDPLIYKFSDETHAAGTSMTIVNTGTADSPWFSILIPSPSATCTITNSSLPAGQRDFTITGLSGATVIDFRAHLRQLPTVTQGGVDKDEASVWPASRYLTLVSGNNVLTCTNSFTPTFRSAWLSA